VALEPTKADAIAREDGTKNRLGAEGARVLEVLGVGASGAGVLGGAGASAPDGSPNAGWSPSSGDPPK